MKKVEGVLLVPSDPDESAIGGSQLGRGLWEIHKEVMRKPTRCFSAFSGSA